MTPRARYAHAADRWKAAGWTTVLPVPVGRKEPVPVGFTGRDGREPDQTEYDSWLSRRPYDNAALVVPVGVVGLDVDAYGGKRGHRTWTQHRQQHGEPGATWIVTSRTDGVSGIRLYRTEMLGPYRGGLDGGHVDVIHHGHRYVMLPPSLHPDGRTYVLLDPDGRPSHAPPSIAALPCLPIAWGRALLRPLPPSGPKRSPAARIEAAMQPARHSDEERWLAYAESVLTTRKGRLYRERAGISLDELAQHLGVKRPRAAHLELGELRSVRRSVRVRYGKFLEEILKSL